MTSKLSRRRGRRLLLAWTLCGSACSLGVACGPAAAPPKAHAAEEVRPAWPDVFDGVPDLYVVVRPRALKRDGVYGTFFTSLLRTAQARTSARGDTMVQAAEGAEEIVVGLDRGSDATLVLRGVPASLDPQKITDAEGSSLFRPKSDRSKVIEYELVDRKSAEEGALFILPDRTWVGALGRARDRARQAFATPLGRPTPSVDPEALFALRVAGPLAHLLDRQPGWSALTKKLSHATFSLKPGKGGVVVALSYTDDDATAWGEAEAKRLVAELSRAESRAWLRDAKIAYEGNTVFVRVAVPPRLLEDLPNASAAAFGF